MTANEGWVSVGIDHDTAEFAVETIRRWWQQMGSAAYPGRERLADHGRRRRAATVTACRLWKVALQELADETGLRIAVCHFPPGTSKWNKIEHRMFCHITAELAGPAAASREVVVNLIGHTTTKAGLQIHAELDANAHTTGGSRSRTRNCSRATQERQFHGDWNYRIEPHAR